MKLITWNCNGAFRKKAARILQLQPDILIVPECESLEKLKFNPPTIEPQDKQWYSLDGKKGIGIFSYSGCRFNHHPSYNKDFRIIVPIEVTGGSFDLLLLAIWAMPDTESGGKHYIGQIWDAVQAYSELLTDRPVILAGDFNSNKIWDGKHRSGNHSDVVKFLAERNIHSAYHKNFIQAQVREEHGTLFMYRHRDKPYHIDYCFASQGLLERVVDVEIGIFEEWIDLSDHMPLSVTFDLAD